MQRCPRAENHFPTGAVTSIQQPIAARTLRHIHNTHPIPVYSWPGPQEQQQQLLLLLLLLHRHQLHLTTQYALSNCSEDGSTLSVNCCSTTCFIPEHISCRTLDRGDRGERGSYRSDSLEGIAQAGPDSQMVSNQYDRLFRVHFTNLNNRYLPTMAAVALGILFIPENIFDEPTKRTITLDQATRSIGMGIDQQLSEHNRRVNHGYELSQEERNRAMLDSYGARSSLDDMEKAIAGYEATRPKGPHERRLALEEAYGDRSSLKHLSRAMQIYEVQ